MSEDQARAVLDYTWDGFICTKGRHHWHNRISLLIKLWPSVFVGTVKIFSFLLYKCIFAAVQNGNGGACTVEVRLSQVKVFSYRK